MQLLRVQGLREMGIRTSRFACAVSAWAVGGLGWMLPQTGLLLRNLTSMTIIRKPYYLLSTHIMVT